MRISRFVPTIVFALTLPGVTNHCFASEAPSLSVTVSASPAASGQEALPHKEEFIDIETDKILASQGITNHCLASEAVDLSVSVSASPSTSTREGLLCKVKLIDIEINKLLASSEITIKKGDTGNIVIRDDVNDNIVFVISINKAGTTITYSATYIKSHIVVGRKKGSISIQRAA